MKSSHTPRTKQKASPKKPIQKKKSRVTNRPKEKLKTLKPAPASVSEKIQKLLANAGIGSRRSVESWITEGRILVNGKRATIGQRITPRDTVQFDGRDVPLAEAAEQTARVLIYHKPEGEICTRNDPENRPTIFKALPFIRNNRWISIGRLDFNTSGILLITNDGQIANQMMHPSSDIEREYAVRVKGNVNDAALQRLQKGVRLEDGMAKFETVIDAGGTGKNHWYHVTVKEGRNRLVRRLWEHFNVTVSRLMRVRFGPIHLPTNLRRGHYVELSELQVANLRDFLNSSKNSH